MRNASSMVRPLAFALVFFLLGSSIMAQSLNNANFEQWPPNCPVNTPPTGWDNFSTSLGPDQAGACAGAVTSIQGSSHMNLVWSNTGLREGAQQNISGLNSGDLYSISFYAIHDQGLYASNGPVKLVVYLDSVVVFTTPAMANLGGWTQFSTNFVAADTNALLGLRVESALFGTSGSVGVDSVSIDLVLCTPTLSNHLITVCDSLLSPSGNYTWTLSGTYQDTIPNAIGCDSLIKVELTVNSSGFDTLNVSRCDSFVTPSGQVLTTSGSYPDTILTTQGCDSLITIHLTIGSADTSISLSGDTLTALANNVLYQWIDCENGHQAIPGEVFQTFVPSQSGTYAVIIIQGNCSDTSSCKNVGITAIGQAQNLSLKLFPNPNQGHFYLELPASSQAVFLSISNHLGQTVYQQTQFPSNVIHIELDGPAGIYYLNLSTPSGQAFAKLVKE